MRAVVVTVRLLDEIWARFQAPERRADMPRAEGAWIVPAGLAAAVVWMWAASAAGGSEREAPLMVLSQGAALCAAGWGLVTLCRAMWRAALAVDE
jgi:hypothetical protein